MELPHTPHPAWKGILLASLATTIPFSSPEARARSLDCSNAQGGGSELRTSEACILPPAAPWNGVILAQAGPGPETFIAADSFNRFTTNTTSTISTSRDTVIGRNSGTVEIITTNSDHPIYLDQSGNAKTVNIVAESLYRSGRRGPYPMTAFYANIVHGTYDLNVANTSSGDILTLSGNEGNNILVGRKNGSFLYGYGGDDTLYIYGSGFADGGPGNDTYILMPPMEETALVASSSLPGILAGGSGRGKLPHINVESADAVYLTGLLPESTEFQTLFYKDQRFNQIRGRLSTLPEGTYLVLTKFNRNYLATIVDVANGAFTAKEAAIVNIPAGNETGIEKIFKKGRGPGKRGASSGGTVDPSSPSA